MRFDSRCSLRELMCFSYSAHSEKTLVLAELYSIEMGGATNPSMEVMAFIFVLAVFED
jgi:hypothetical protein